VTAIPRVVSIVGPGRSGTTLLGEILGEVPGVFDAGELRWLWRRGLGEGRRCGCGEPVPECPVWSEVLRRSGAALDPARVTAWQQTIGEKRSRWTVLSGSPGSGGLAAAMDGYAALLRGLLAAVSEVTAARVVVDTSKRAVDAALVRRAVPEAHAVVHVVRDPRAVAYSWQRLKSNPGSDHDPFLGRRTPVASAARWMENTVSAEILKRRTPRVFAVRYEDFAARPAATIGGLLEFLGEDPAGNPVEGDGTVMLRGNHTVAGNPDRFRTAARTAVRSDDAWRTELSAADRRAVTALTLPALPRYGYPLRGAGPAR
jgi:hypothetical protein